MDLLHGLMYGFSVSLQPANLLACFVGVFVGTLIGVLPGIGPVATMSLLLPITFAMSPTASIIMMAGIYYGAMYGGSTTSILVNIPGEAASVVTCIDGYQMARQGRAGPALGMAALGSFIAGTFSVLGIMVLAPPLTSIALRFGPPEIFGLLLLGFTMVTYLTAGSKLKAVAMALLLYYGGLRTLNGTLTVGVLAAFIQLTRRFFQPLQGAVGHRLDDVLGAVQGDLAALVAQALAHRRPEGCRVDELHLALSRIRLPVADDPDIGADASVVEDLVRQGDDPLQPVALDDPAADVALALAGVAGEERAAVVHLSDAAAEGGLGVHL